MKSGSAQVIEVIRGDKPVSASQLLRLVVAFATPAILAQISAILMQCIDAAMVGRLGAESTAAIGLVSTTIWLVGGVMSSTSAGFSVQVAHLIGSGRHNRASMVVRQALMVGLAVAAVMMTVGLVIAPHLPVWLGGASDVVPLSTSYFTIFCISLPILITNYMAGSILRCSGNVFIVGALNVVMCCLDVLFNFFLIFGTRQFTILGLSLTVPGAGLGVVGAAVGTLLAELVSGGVMFWFLCTRCKELALTRHPGRFRLTAECVFKAFKIGSPMAVEHTAICGAQIAGTMIVAPLGTVAVAANSLGITAESLCYMPGYGIGDASTTLVGQSLGAKRSDLARKFALISLALGIGSMTVLGVVMYVFAPEIFAALTPVAAVQSLGAEALRIEAFAEPMFAASIVSYAIFVGMGDTIVPCFINLGCMWLVRITLAATLAPLYGLKGVWFAMCLDLCLRGIIMLVRVKFTNWSKCSQKS